MDCIICISNIEFNDKQTLSCEHIFHKNCIIDWFKVKTNNCPICKCKNTNIIKPIIINFLNPRYNELENLVLNNLNKNWNYPKLTLNSKITKKFVKENPYIHWNIENIYTIYQNDPELCELILQHQINTISSKRIFNITKRVRISFIFNFPNHNWNWDFLSSVGDDGDSDNNSDSEENDTDHQYDSMPELDDPLPELDPEINPNMEVIDEDYQFNPMSEVD
jgi:hypothetical protein